MTIVELGPDDGNFEWKHVLPNDFTCKFFSSSAEKLSNYNAHER